MPDEKDYEIPKHRKKSPSANRSVSARRADHRHDYEKVIIQEDSADPLKSCWWARRCRICGRVEDRGRFKTGAKAGLVEKTVRVAGSRIDVYFTAAELREKYPGVPILVKTSARGEYEDLDIRKSRGSR